MGQDKSEAVMAGVPECSMQAAARGDPRTEEIRREVGG